MISLGVIVVSYNVKKRLKKCLESLFNSKCDIGFKTVVIDNASFDKSAGAVEREFPQVYLIRNDKNLGFASANNIALNFLVNKYPKIKYVLFLNPDIILEQRTISYLTDYLRNNQHVGCVGPALIYPNEKPQTGGAGFDPGIITGFNYFFFLSVIFPRWFKGVFINQRFFIKRKKPVNVDWLAGACLMARTKVITEVGMLDETFFLYGEDAEWCSRVKKKGWIIQYLSFLSVVHFHGESSKVCNSSSFLWLIGLFKYVKTKGIFSYIVFRLLAIVGFTLRSFIYLILSIIYRNSKYRSKSIKIAKWAGYCFRGKW